ncbi:MAG: hypothetical protein H6713_26305 [Myxococcales bacterium]|nr:hypothetical protein [Myxococcales bacterium]MCB9753470.1 hypothetical protein [Myxococcales bacterium]
MSGRRGPAFVIAAVLIASASACAPGQVERVEFRDADGEVRRVELPRGASLDEVAATLGPPTARREGLQATYWMYSFAGARFDYVFVFKNKQLQRVDYVDRRGERP